VGYSAKNLEILPHFTLLVGTVTSISAGGTGVGKAEEAFASGPFCAFYSALWTLNKDTVSNLKELTTWGRERKHEPINTVML
jgi:4-hydroxybenzoate polyprenyltransferase